MIFEMSTTRARELGLITCKCGHPENNHFSHGSRQCAHCHCPGYSEVGVKGVQIRDKYYTLDQMREYADNFHLSRLQAMRQDERRKKLPPAKPVPELDAKDLPTDSIFTSLINSKD